MNTIQIKYKNIDKSSDIHNRFREELYEAKMTVELSYLKLSAHDRNTVYFKGIIMLPHSRRFGLICCILMSKTCHRGIFEINSIELSEF